VTNGSSFNLQQLRSRIERYPLFVFSPCYRIKCKDTLAKFTDDAFLGIDDHFVVNDMHGVVKAHLGTDNTSWDLAFAMIESIEDIDNKGSTTRDQYP